MKDLFLTLNRYDALKLLYWKSIVQKYKVVYNPLNIILMEMCWIGCYSTSWISTILLFSSCISSKSPVDRSLSHRCYQSISLSFQPVINIFLSVTVHYSIILVWRLSPGTKRWGPHSLALKEPLLGYSAVFVNSRAHAHGCLSLPHASAVTLLLSNMAVLWKQEKCWIVLVLLWKSSRHG